MRIGSCSNAGPFIRRASQPSRGSWERNSERAAVRPRRHQREPAAVGLNGALRDRQPKSGARFTPIMPCAKESIEDAIASGRRYPLPAVDDLERHGVGRLAHPDPDAAAGGLNLMALSTRLMTACRTTNRSA